MELTRSFNTFSSATAQNNPRHFTGRSRRPAPFSLRLTAAERDQLVAEARGLPLGTYIKEKLLSHRPVRLRTTCIPIEDRSALAQSLALLGRSRLASNLNQLARAANIGALVLTPELEAQLRTAFDDVRFMRSLLMKALGLKGEPLP
jgi:hypothetical protein